MTDTAARIVGPAFLANAAATIYTVPGSTSAILRNIHVANETAAVVNLTLSIALTATADAAGKRLFSAYPVPANGVVDWSGFIVLNATDLLIGFAGTASALTICVNGVLVT